MYVLKSIQKVGESAFLQSYKSIDFQAELQAVHCITPFNRQPASFKHRLKSS